MPTVKNATVKPVTPAQVIAAETKTAEPAKIESLLVRMNKENEISISLEDRLHRLNVLFDLQKKYNALQASLQKLSVFKLTHDSETSVLRFRDDDHNEFSTGNAEVMAEFLDFLKETIKRKIKAIEPLLIW